MRAGGSRGLRGECMRGREELRRRRIGTRNKGKMGSTAKEGYLFFWIKLRKLCFLICWKSRFHRNLLSFDPN
jgi:hypothetical protein